MTASHFSFGEDSPPAASTANRGAARTFTEHIVMWKIDLQGTRTKMY